MIILRMIVPACYNLACLVNTVIYLVLSRLGLIYVLKRRIFTISAIMCPQFNRHVSTQKNPTRGKFFIAIAGFPSELFDYNGYAFLNTKENLKIVIRSSQP
jgi:hypothetical protein